LLNVILDANIYIDALEDDNFICKTILYREYLREFKTIISNDMLEELLFVYKNKFYYDMDQETYGKYLLHGLDYLGGLSH
jgi:predicted nucleic acid-binding protein